jgi:GNAT superfamily N-acetyltransferase
VTPQDLVVRALTPAERPGLPELLAQYWGSPQIVSRGQAHDASQAEALGAFREKWLVGLATYEITDGQCELLTLNAFEAGHGVGSLLLDAVAEHACAARCRRLWLITTNDNLTAIRFYERRGLRLAAVHHGAVDEARKLKPSIPECTSDGTRISDELEFELGLL